MNHFILSNYGLKRTTAVDGFKVKEPTKVDMPLNKEINSYTDVVRQRLSVKDRYHPKTSLNRIAKYSFKSLPLFLNLKLRLFKIQHSDISHGKMNFIDEYFISVLEKNKTKRARQKKKVAIF